MKKCRANEEVFGQYLSQKWSFKVRGFLLWIQWSNAVLKKYTQNLKIFIYFTHGFKIVMSKNWIGKNSKTSQKKVLWIIFLWYDILYRIWKNNIYNVWHWYIVNHLPTKQWYCYPPRNGFLSKAKQFSLLPTIWISVKQCELLHGSKL